MTQQQINKRTEIERAFLVLSSRESKPQIARLMAERPCRKAAK